MPAADRPLGDNGQVEGHLCSLAQMFLHSASSASPAICV
jgi:hypothetical protein